MNMNKSVVYALVAAVLFGASTPLAKLLVNMVSPVMLGGLLYLGSGIGMLLIRLLRDRGWRASGLQPGEWPWLLGAIAFGGVLGPVALMFGLTSTSGSTASLLLNLEAVLTAVLAWVVFRENADRRVVAGMLAIVAGGLVLSWPSGAVETGSGWIGPAAIGLACLCWAIDNNLTRKVALADATWIASIKGLVAGLVNVSLGLMQGTVLPPWSSAAAAMFVGFFAYGVSLALFVVGLRHLGTARTGAYFSIAPFIGAILAVVLGEQVTVQLLVAGALMALGVWWHITERHVHEHTHEVLVHAHTHIHDEHHQHAHEFPVEPGKKHSHLHSHLPMTHDHAHFPDTHHRHDH